MNLAEIAMKYRTVVFTFVAMLTAWGTYTFTTMPRREDPAFTIRTCVVSTSWPGTPAIKVEELVTDKIEDELDSIEEVDYLKSETTTGQSVIYVNLEDNVPPSQVQQVWDKVRARIDKTPMPDENVRPIVNDEFGDTSIMVLGVYQTPLEGEDSVDEQNRYSSRELEVYADRVRDALRVLPGVAKVEKYGVQNEAIYIETDLGTWSQLELTSSQLKRLVADRNIVLPGGDFSTPDGKFNVKPSGEFDAMSEIESVSVAGVKSGDSYNRVSITDIGLTVRRDAVDPPQVICRFTEPRGTFPAVMVGMTMKSGENIVQICDAATERINRLINVDQALPRDITVRPISKLSDNVTKKINEVIVNVVEAIIIVVIVVFLFVGLRTSMVMAANIPFVVLGSIALIRLFGVELEQISLASIIIALGLLVDNAVQVCDQTRVNILSGMTPRDAAVQGAKSLAMPMLVGTLTTVAAFLPMLIALTGGGAEYVYSLPVTLSTTLLLSWFYAMTVCVLLSAIFIRAPKNPLLPNAPLPWLNYQADRYFSAWMAKRRRNKDGNQQGQAVQDSDTAGESLKVATAESPTGGNVFLAIYGLTARIALKFKWITVLTSVVMLVATLQLPVSSEFFPVDRRDQFYVQVTLPETSTVEQTNLVVAQAEQILKKLSPFTDSEGNAIERLRAMRSMTAQGGARWSLGVNPPAPETNTAEILIRTTAGELTEGMITDFRDAVEAGNPELGIEPIAGARITTKRIQMGPPANPVEIRVSGEGFADIPELRRIVEEIKQMLRDDPDTWDVADSWGVDGFQLNVDVDEEKASLSGVTSANVADTLNAYFTGLQLTTFREGDHLVPVYFRLRPEDREDLSGIDNAFVEGTNGKLPLGSIAKVVQTWQPGKIERRDQNRTVEVSSEVRDGASGNDVVQRIFNSDQMKDLRKRLPVGYKVEIGGALEESQDAGVQMMTSFLISILLIVLILVIQYNGWSKTLVILTTLPLAMIGAWFGLWLTDNPLGFMPQLGLLSLFGIVLNTGIIFMEFADILIAEKRDELQRNHQSDGPIVGLSKVEFRECLIAAGKQRMLPIFLTTATTIGGLLPLALTGGPLWIGMAWLMIFGLIVATLLTLYIVPALYAIIVETFGIRPVPAVDGDDVSGPVIADGGAAAV
ncbi:Toluene efflux pump membrane transporter TtgE [Rubripirellula lacrimiformis]|uniref:Toluene efflux pump membrane transporter TtgE n=1 Tax=Rubripirellula lacrimiformis TaxID=1930273 RepID=A0A517NAF3_9BACT|nr:efflux RND transporter permease subunit [Rubripirellula lacrimiformis]QDT03998.1 Toluene efflux pump membrane transporter TtgE [Rubripirellula lacrimiformis]